MGVPTQDGPAPCRSCLTASRTASARGSSQRMTRPGAPPKSMATDVIVADKASGDTAVLDAPSRTGFRSMVIKLRLEEFDTN
jgi:hypothetical protein